MKNLEKSVHEKPLHKRRGLILIAAYILIEVALFAGSQIGHIRCLHILATLLTPLAFFYALAVFPCGAESDGRWWQQALSCWHWDWAC